MLIGCDCHCDLFDLSGFPSGSALDQSFSGGSLLESQSINPDTGYCGNCYNLPWNWKITIPEDWFQFSNPYGTWRDCRNQIQFAGTHILRPYGLSNATPRMRDLLRPLNPSARPNCTVWQSDALTRFTNIYELNGTPAEPCRYANVRSPESGEFRTLPTWELAVITDFGGAYFILGAWWTQNWVAGEHQVGRAWSWQVPLRYDPDTGNLIYQNCVRCFLAESVLINWQIALAYDTVGPYPGYEINAIPVCPG
jgi:hypothetical protein